MVESNKFVTADGASSMLIADDRACRLASVRAENRFGQFSDLTTTRAVRALPTSNAAEMAKIVASFPGRSATSTQHTYHANGEGGSSGTGFD